MAERFPKDCWKKNCPHFHTRDLSVDDLVCTCDLCKKEIEFPKYKFLIRTDDGCTINSITYIMDEIEYDLCDECKEKIMTYVNDIRR